MKIESFEKPKTQDELLERYDMKFTDKQDITLTDLQEMKEKGVTTEMLLNFLEKKYNYLFHGSRNDIPFTEKLLSSEKGKIFASSNPAIAILKAIYLNNAKNLGYPLNLAEDNSNLTLVVNEPKEGTVGEQGYVYIVSDKDSFEEDSNSNWQYFSKEKEVSFVKKIQVEKDDFKYPVIIK